jgi:hypothetical protein
MRNVRRSVPTTREGVTVISNTVVLGDDDETASYRGGGGITPHSPGPTAAMVSAR